MPTLVRNGWKIYFFSAFWEIYNNLTREAESVKEAQPLLFASHPKARLLKRIQEIIFDEIPADPGHARYNLGNTLGAENRHWRRVKFLNRFRLFFRYHGPRKIIVYAWVNDEKSPRREGSRKDPYAIFQKRLTQGDPPNDWDDLLKQSEPVDGSDLIERRS